MTYPYQPPKILQGPGQDEIRAIAEILSNYQNETTAVRALNKYWGGTHDTRAIRAALRLADHDRTRHRGTQHSPRVRGTGGAARETQRGELSYRAAFVGNSARRINARMAAGRDLQDAVSAERHYYAQHEFARKQRQSAALAVDAAAEMYGDKLGWYSHEDGRTTPDCRAATGTNFSITSMPTIGWPGSVHPHCRCFPGPPYATRRTTEAVTLRTTH